MGLITPLEEVEELFSSAQTSSMRRTVISRAYYVSFRSLVGVATLEGFKQNVIPQPNKKFQSVHRRLFDMLRGSRVPVLVKIGRILIEPLWDLRVKADYRFSSPVTKSEAEEAVFMARNVEDWITEAGLKSVL